MLIQGFSSVNAAEEALPIDEEIIPAATPAPAY
jgi:hypothetical protein